MPDDICNLIDFRKYYKCPYYKVYMHEVYFLILFSELKVHGEIFYPNNYLKL